MTAFDPGAIIIEIELAGDRVRTARVVSTRPTGHRRLFDGRTAAEAPVLSRRLFALCAKAQAAASAEAVAAAAGVRRPDALRTVDTVGVLAERVAESLRASVLGWPWGEVGSPPRSAAAPLRDAMAAASLLIAATDADLANPAPLSAAAARLAAAAEALGAADEMGTPPAPGSAFAVLAAQCAGEPFLAAGPPDALTPADDGAVVTALRSDPDGFAARPALAGRRPETGAFARFWRESAPEDAFAARLAARRRDIRDTLAALCRTIAGVADPDGTLTGGPAGERSGYGAVECARGRLYHSAELDLDGRIVTYAVLAPTEWNFHGDGPYVEALVGARLGEGEAARLAAARLAALIDPCVAFRVALEG